MKLNTRVHAAFRNLGDSQDSGEFFEGPLNEAILFIATKLSKVYLANRIVIGIGRDRAGAALAIESNRAGKSLVTDDMKAMLDSILNDEGEDGEPPVAPQQFASDPLDSWKGE